MMKCKWGVCLFAGWMLLASSPAGAQSPPSPDFERAALFPSYAAFHDSLTAVVNVEDAAVRDSLLDVFWDDLLDGNQVPYAQGESVAFLYRGAASSVAWRGDFNGWGESPGVRLGDTDVWMFETTLPADARTDYKVFRNGSEWMLDPANPLEMWSGFGPNSELRMPAYVYPMETVRRNEVGRGALSEDVTLHSDRLGYDVNYRVYTPPGYFALDDLPVVYVTDGHEYAADHLGSMVVVLDNLIADARIPPVMAVFIDPRNPANLSENRRGSEYVANPAFADFVADELVPVIDAAYRTRATADGRAILGTSLGGLNSAYFGATKTGVFHNVAIQSPAFWAWPEIYDRYRDTPFLDLRIFMSNGTLHDGDGGPTMAAILEEKGYTFKFIETHEGHSWGQWRGLIDEALLYFFGEAGVVAVEHETPSAEAPALASFPNPARGEVRVTFRLPRASPVRLAVYDVLGRLRATLLDGERRGPGAHTVRLAAGGWPSGVYVIRLATAFGAATERIVFTR
ncbi:alpha/beta hydrolase-fold protein [Rhodocaloribacter sp.]